MIRPATTDDIPALTAMGERFFAATQWADLFEYHPDDFVSSVQSLMALPNFICLVDDSDGLIGVAAGIVAPVYFNHAHLSGEELFWWADDQAPPMTGTRLLVALEEAAQALGCSSWQMKCIDRLNGPRMAKFYERRGYVVNEHSFIKRF